MTAAMNSFGQIFRITLWGESHGPRIGVSIDGVDKCIDCGTCAGVCPSEAIVSE